MSRNAAPLPLPRVAPRVLRQEVLTALRAAILDGSIAPGDRLLEAEVAARMGVSRAPVREAMRQLEQEGLIATQAHRGAIVRGLPDDEVDAVYELRAVIEGRAIERACRYATPDDLAALDLLVAEMEAARTAGATDELAELDLRFHRALIELSGYGLLRQVWSSLDGLVRTRTHAAISDTESAAGYFLAASASSHAVLVAAIRAGDPERAAALAHRHVLEVPERLRAAGTSATRPA